MVEEHQIFMRWTKEKEQDDGLSDEHLGFPSQGLAPNLSFQNTLVAFSGGRIKVCSHSLCLEIHVKSSLK